MDVTTILTMFREMMDEQRNVMNEQKNFVFDPDADMIFSKWFSRYKDVFNEDAKQLSENTKVRLLCEKLDPISFEKYQRHVLPRDVTEIGFTETVDILKQLFDFKSSLFTTRYQCLKLEKSQSEDCSPRIRGPATPRTGVKCLSLDISRIELSSRRQQISSRLITILDRDHKAGKTVSLQQLHQEETVKLSPEARNSKPRRSEKRKEIECWNCEGKHRASGCQAKPWFCKKCRKVGHKERFCDTLRQKKTASRTEATQKTQHTKEKFSRNRNNRGPRKQVRIVKIANAAVQANSSRVYIDAVVNNYSVKFLLDTGSDITLLNEKIWKRWLSPALEKTNIVVKKRNEIP
ncbi:hypothetical protein COOONC_23263 [Cooperia oncophora]